MKDLITFLKIGLPPGEAAAAARAAASPADDGAAAEEAPAPAAEEAAPGIFALEAAIQEASAAGVDPGEVSSAQSRLQQMKERRERAALALKSASGISALEAAIQEALAAGVDPGDVSSAQSRLQEMTKEQQHQDDETMSSLYKMTSEEHSLEYSEERRTSLL